MGDGDERCPKNTGWRKSECAHCQGLERGTADNPHFSLKELSYNGFPVVEVLMNGGQVGWWDAHFQFGQRKVEMLIACMDILEKFWLSTDDDRRGFAPQLVEKQTSGLRVQVYVKMHPCFERLTGTTIDRPWLHLQALPPDNYDIGLGAMKCRAICAVRKPLRLWCWMQRFPGLDKSHAEEIVELIDKPNP
jgi:hypothetical protein